MNKKTNQEPLQKLAKRIATNQISMKPKYWPKDCGSCDWNNALCDFHLEYNYERILQKIAREKRERNKWRMILGVSTLFLLAVLLFVLSMFWRYPTAELEDFASVFHLFGQSIVYLPWVIWLLWRNEKDSQRWLREYEQDKTKWVRN